MAKIFTRRYHQDTFKRTQYIDTDEGRNNILRHYTSHTHQIRSMITKKNTISYLLLHPHCQCAHVRHEISHRIQVRYARKKMPCFHFMLYFITVIVECI
jgi:hypothetical protein